MFSGGAVKGGIIAGGTGAVVGALAAADHNRRGGTRYIMMDPAVLPNQIEVNPRFYTAFAVDCYSSQEKRACPFAEKVDGLWPHHSAIAPCTAANDPYVTHRYLHAYQKNTAAISMGIPQINEMVQLGSCPRYPNSSDFERLHWQLQFPMDNPHEIERFATQTMSVIQRVLKLSKS